MPLFGVLLTGDEEVRKEIRGKISEKYKEKKLHVGNDFYIISTKESLAREVAETVGIYSTPQRKDTSGVIFRLNGSYAGLASGKVWDWIDDQIKIAS